MNQIFPGKTAVYVSSPYRSELPCEISGKSLERFSRKITNQLTNCRVLKDLAHLLGLFFYKNGHRTKTKNGTYLKFSLL